MPIVYQNPTYPWQTSFAGQQAASTQLNFREMLNEVTQWNPDVDPMVAGRWINNYYRKIIDMRSWYALKLKGQISVSGIYQTGQVITTLGSPFVTGVGTNWSTAPQNLPGSLVGQQFRTSFTFAYQTVTNVASPTLLQLDTPFGTTGPIGATGYQIVNAYIDFGANIKRLLWAVNQQQGWKMKVNVPIESINSWDTWRTNLGWSTHFAVRSMTPGGSMIQECWPTPFQQQIFPFEAYQQPPNLFLDNDAPVPWIASDLIVTRAVADALVFKGPKKNPYYDATTSMAKKAEFSERVEQMAMADNNMDQQDVTWNYGEEGEEWVGGWGSTYWQNHG